MADKKITIKPSDMERLRELMRREEEKLDAANPSDAELAAMEEELENSIRHLAKKIPGNLPSVDQEMDRNWNALQEKLKAAPAPQKDAEVLQLQPRKRNKALPWLGVIAAAALVMIMIRPAGRNDDIAMNNSQVQIKGTDGPVSKVNCEVDAAGLDNAQVVPASNGLGFEGPAGAKAEISIKCESDGYLVALITGPEKRAFEFPVKAGERTRFLRDGKVAEFTLQSGRPWVMSLVLADQDYKDQPVPQDHILWQDPKVEVGARE